VIFGMQSPSLDEVARWVLSYGAEAEVLAPSDLRDKMQSTLAKALENYKSSNSTLAT